MNSFEMTKLKKINIFDYKTPSGNIAETFDNLFSNNDLIIERIVTHRSPEDNDNWFDQKKNEWVILLSGKAVIEFENNEITELNTGDYIFIPAHKKHRVLSASINPKCVWLGVHFK